MCKIAHKKICDTARRLLAMTMDNWASKKHAKQNNYFEISTTNIRFLQVNSLTP